MREVTEQKQTERTPTRGCYEAADYLIDFQTQDGVSNSFKASLEDCPTEADAIAALARHINNATGVSKLLAALEAVDASGVLYAWANEKSDGIPNSMEEWKRRCAIVDQMNAAISKAKGEQS